MKPQVAPYRYNDVELRLLKRDDLPMTLAWRNRYDVRMWFNTSDIIGEDQHQIWFERYLDKTNDFVFIVEVDGRPVGQVSIYAIDAASGSAEIGRFIAAPGEDGKGYMRAAIAGLIELAKWHFKLNRIYLEVFEHNERAIGLYQKLGFQKNKASSNMLEFSMSIQQ